MESPKDLFNSYKQLRGYQSKERAIAFRLVITQRETAEGRGGVVTFVDTLFDRPRRAGRTRQTYSLAHSNKAFSGGLKSCFIAGFTGKSVTAANIHKHQQTAEDWRQNRHVDSL